MIQNLTGIVLKQRNWGENDLLLSVLDENGERQDLIVKGAGQGKSKRRSHLELMNKIRGTVYNNAKHSYLQSVQCENSYFQLKQNFQKVFQTHVLLEVIEQSLMLEDPHPQAYELLLTTLEHLNEEDACALGAEIGLVKWGQHLGILPSFKICGSCHQVIKGIARWNGEKQILLCEECGGMEGETLELNYRKALEFFKTASFHECKKIHFKEEEHSKLRELIPYFFRNHLERPLKSLSMAYL